MKLNAIKLRSSRPSKKSRRAAWRQPRARPAPPPSAGTIAERWSRRRAAWRDERVIKASSQARNHMANPLCGCGLLYNDDGDSPGAQTVRWGGAGPVGNLLDG